MTKKIPIYLVVRPTGQKTRDGVELFVIVGQKTSRSKADAMAELTPGDRVQKITTDE